MSALTIVTATLSIVWVIIFVPGRAMHFYHGYTHGKTSLPRLIGMAERCRTDSLLREELGKKCDHYMSVGDWQPYIVGWEFMRDNTHLCGDPGCWDTLKSFGYLGAAFIFAGVLALFVGARLLTTFAGTRKKEHNAENGGHRLRGPEMYMDNDEWHRQQLINRRPRLLYYAEDDDNDAQ